MISDIRTTTINIRGARRKETILIQVMKHNDVRGLSETWFNGEEMEHRAHMSVAINQGANHENNRSFRLAALAITPIIKYKTVSKMAQPKYQVVAVRLTGCTITICYTSIWPSATARWTEERMSNIQRHTGDKGYWCVPWKQDTKIGTAQQMPD